ncbi:MAG: hypothetical protein HY000_03840 [Planctomycetes bacterium]|nr:hypothetical protein [Planctomycetota bacterium]
MALGRRKREQQGAWVATSDLPKSPGHPFYEKLNQLLAEAGFEPYVEQLCRPYDAEGQGRPSIPPGVYFRMLLVGYFEGIGAVPPWPKRRKTIWFSPQVQRDLPGLPGFGINRCRTGRG